MKLSPKYKMRTAYSKPCLLIVAIACILFTIVYVPTARRFIGVYDGGYTQWTQWTDCSKSCGGGLRARRRNCSNPIPKGWGKNCVSFIGPNIKTESCSNIPCPGRPDNWEKWQPCSKSCGAGEEIRKRSCIIVEVGGKPCSLSSLTEKRSCQIMICPHAPVDGHWTEWKPVRECNRPCSEGVLHGMQEVMRYCDNPAPAHGGKPCEGNNRMSMGCNLFQCPIVLLPIKQEETKEKQTEEKDSKEKKVNGTFTP